MMRSSDTTPGYDHIRHPCGKNSGAAAHGCGHGIASDTWIYTVRDHDLALVLRVSSGVYPKSVPPETLARMNATGRYPLGVDLDLHSSKPTGESIRDPGEGTPCDYVVGGRCWIVWRSSLHFAEKLFGNHGARSFEQPEAFWLTLERQLNGRGQCREWSTGGAMYPWGAHNYCAKHLDEEA